MPNALTGPDVLREYLTGADADNEQQPLSAESLGGFRSSNLAHSFQLEVTGQYSSMHGVMILSVSGGNPTGVGYLYLTETTIAWQPFGASQPGTPVTFEVGQTKIVDAFNMPGQFIRLLCTGPLNEGKISLKLSDLKQNVFAMAHVSSAQATSGQSTYRAVIVRNEAPFTVFGFLRWIEELAPMQNGDNTALLVSGAGTLVTTGSFSGWPESGWCRILKSDSSLREIVYYTSRTDDTLTVPAAGRARLGSTADDGELTDTLHSVPGIAIGLASEGVQDFGNSIELIANQNTAPTGVTWNTSIVPADGLDVPSLAVGKQIGIWIWRETPVGATYSKGHINRIGTAFDSTQISQSGKYRIQNISVRGYLTWIGINAMPDLSAPADSFSTSLPVSIAHALPVSDEILYIVTRYQNAYGMVSKNQRPKLIYLGPGGVNNDPVPPPTQLVLALQTNASIVVLSRYSTRLADANSPDKVKVWIGTVMPDTNADAPTAIANIVGDNMRIIISSNPPGTYFVLAANYRTSDDSLSIALSGTIVVPPIPDQPIPL